MTKKFLVAAGAAVLTLGMSMSAFAADVPTDYEAYFDFDESLGDATAVEKGDGGTVGGAATKEFNYADGKNGKAVAINDGEEKDNVGLDTNVSLNGTDSFTISFWAKAEDAPFAAPVVWAGATSQPSGGESWIGFWAGFNDGTWNATAGIGSNTTGDPRYGAVASLSETQTFGFDYITMAVDATTHQAVLYYNGKEVTKTEGGELPVLADGSHVYIGANAWDAPANMLIDDFTVYKRALSADEVAALYEVNGIPKADAEKVEQEETKANEKTTLKVNMDPNKGLATTTPEETTEESSSNVGLIIGIVVAVLVVAVIVGVVIATKKKKS